MEIDPHTIQQILTKVREQLRCPQCRKRVDVTLESLQVVGDDFAVLQLKCNICDAFIMLYASVAGSHSVPPSSQEEGVTNANGENQSRSSRSNARGAKEAAQNFSSRLLIDADDLEILRKALKEANGSFLSLFEEESK